MTEIATVALLKARIAELEGEVAKLKGALERAEGDIAHWQSVALDDDSDELAGEP